MNSLGWSISLIIGLLAYAISDSVKVGILWGGGFALVMLLIIWMLITPVQRKSRRRPF